MSEDRSRDIRRADAILQKIRSLGGLSIQDRTYHLRSYYSCFIASELVDWLITSGEAEDRAQAVILGQLLVDTDYIHHVVDEHNFEDAYLFFRFRQDEPPHEAMSGPSVAYMKGEQGTLISLLAKRRPLALGWSYGVFALSSKNKKIYQFKSELDSSPVQVFCLECMSVQPDAVKASGRFSLQFYENHPQGKEKALCLAADNVDTQFMWIRALSSSGVEVLQSPEEETAQLRNATSIFEFSAVNIDKKIVSLDKYRGHVTLIVNVASQ